MFCHFKKHYEDTSFITMQYQIGIDRLEKQFKIKIDTETEVKVSVSFDDFPAYDAKYHLQYFNTDMRDSKSDQTSAMHQYCFALLICQID